MVGEATQVKAIGYYTQSSDTTDFRVWLYEDYLAAGFGYYMSIGDASQSPNLQLIGCVIDGVSHGRVTGVVRVSDPVIASVYALYPAFPNPLNL